MPPSVLRGISEGLHGGLSLKENTCYIMMHVIMRAIKMKKMKLKNSDTFLVYAGYKRKNVRTTVCNLFTHMWCSKHTYFVARWRWAKFNEAIRPLTTNKAALLLLWHKLILSDLTLLKVTSLTLPQHFIFYSLKNELRECN